MSRKNTFIILGLVVIIVLGIGAFWLYQKTRPGVDGGEGTSTLNPFPFGNPNTTGGTNSGSTDSQDTSGTDTNTDPLAQPKLRQVSAEPVAGGIAYTTTDKQNHIRYVERATGHIFETPFDIFDKTRVSIATIPKIYQSFWSKEGKGVLLQYLKETTGQIETFSLSLLSTSTIASGRPAEGVFLPKNITSVAVSPTRDEVFYIVPNETGVLGFISNPTNTRKTQVFSSPFKEWLVSWPSKDSIAIAPKPANGIFNHLFLLNTKTNKLSKVLSNVSGLTALVNTDATAILYSGSAGANTKLFIKSLKTSAVREMPFTTLPEKCVWSHTKKLVAFCAVPKDSLDQNLPDSWYKGLISFNDQVWRADVETGSTDLVIDPEEFGAGAMDMTDFSLSDDDTALTFMNKKDLTYWALNLK